MVLSFEDRSECLTPRIAIIGVGQLGSRYVEGLLKSPSPVEIWLQDPLIRSVNDFNSWTNLYKFKTNTHFLKIESFYNKIPNHFDLVISATTSDVRFESLSKFLNKKTFDYLILEKPLTTKFGDLVKLKNLVERSSGCWVNHPMRVWPIYQQLKSEVQSQGPIQVVTKGTNWGLATSSGHYCDLVRWLTQENLLSINSDEVERRWIKSKRKGFYNFFGKLIYKFSGGSVLELNSLRPNTRISPQILKTTINTKRGHYVIEESTGLISGNLLNMKVKNPTLLQSEITLTIVKNILTEAKCTLPSFQEVYEDHAIFLTELLKYQKKKHLNYSRKVKIT